MVLNVHQLMWYNSLFTGELLLNDASVSDRELLALQVLCEDRDLLLVRFHLHTYR